MIDAVERHSQYLREKIHGQGHLSATRMSFIVQIFSLLYSYVWYHDDACVKIALIVSVVVSLLYLIFLLNKCEYIETISSYSLPYHTSHKSSNNIHSFNIRYFHTITIFNFNLLPIRITKLIVWKPRFWSMGTRSSEYNLSHDKRLWRND